MINNGCGDKMSLTILSDTYAPVGGRDRSLRGLCVGITYNTKGLASPGPVDAQAEYDDISTVLAIRDALESGGAKVNLYEALDDLPLRIIKDKPDIVFNIAEGVHGRGRESHVPALLSFLQIPYTGSDETTMCVTMDKAIAKLLARACGVCTPEYRMALYGSPFDYESLTYPVIVKPNAEGSGKGISDVSVAKSEAELRLVLDEKLSVYKQDMLVERFIAGREFTVGMVGNGEKLHVFPPMEIIFNAGDHGVYNYEVKRDFKRYTRYQCPPALDADTVSVIEDAARRVYKALGCKDFSRADFRLSADGVLYFLELNPLPGLAPGYSDLPILAEFCGVDYQSLILSVIESALERYGIKSYRGDGLD